MLPQEACTRASSVKTINFAPSTALIASFTPQYHISQLKLLSHSLEGAQGQVVSVAEFWRVGTMGVANIVVKTYYQEYNTYFRTIRQRPVAPDQ